MMKKETRKKGINWKSRFLGINFWNFINQLNA